MSGSDVPLAPTDDELSNAISLLHMQWLIAVIEQEYLQLASVIRVDNSSADGDATLQC